MNVPHEGLRVVTDHVGLASGAKVDKSGLFQVFRGRLAHAPMVEECPLTMECRLVHTVDQPSNEFFIGEIVETYCDPGCLVDGGPDITRLKPLTLTMPDNRYWAVGAQPGQAWSDGTALAKRCRRRVQRVAPRGGPRAGPVRAPNRPAPH